MTTTTPVHRQRLDQLPTGSRAIVRHIESSGDALHRLMAMGLCIGREVEVVRHGNPLIIRFLGARVGVSARLAQHILMEHR